MLVQSPFPDAEIRVAVVRHGVLWETTQRTRSAAPTVRFTVTPDMLPNAAVEAFAVRRGPPPHSAPGDRGNALARVGFAPFAVALDGKYVVASARAGAPSLEPGARQTVDVHLADAAHAPVQGELTVIVANDAVLRLSGYRPPDLVKTVYAEQPISTRYADNRSALALATPGKPLEKGWGFGGGLSGDEADPRVRRKFAPLAYFGTLRTDANGDAQAVVRAARRPDHLARAGRRRDRRRPLRQRRDDLPHHQAAGRQPRAPAVRAARRPLRGRRRGHQRHRQRAARCTSSAALSGPLAFLVGDKPVATTVLDAPLDRITKAYRFPMIATGSGEATATIRVRARGRRRRLRGSAAGARPRRRRGRRRRPAPPPPAPPWASTSRRTRRVTAAGWTSRWPRR